ncbi:M28 family peptidase [Mobilicoccus caccae]|uniref:Folate hydrolase n=1 Tax=Mobilicoccus caccae TaxID=1859295 RepID=A0ABQ6IV45_9MICO|nr:M28 family peptidase [Mobilicoccus caccae]GMA40563.1 folate hydrolase [Mobilicoccus caccae]
MRRLSTTVAMVATLGLALTPATALAATSDEQTPADRAAAYGSPRWQTQYEQNLRAEIDPAHPVQWMRDFGRTPSHVGTPGNARSLEAEVAALKKAGLEVEVDTYQVLATKPKSISVRQTAPVERDLAVVEDDVDMAPEDLPIAYNAYSPAGSVSGEIVYVNYGRPQDFAELERRGVSVEGKIALARYGQNFRGVKPDQAAKAGAIGMIMFSDPSDDGFVRGDTFPDGPWRPDDGIQRGSVLRLWDRPGDPLTPGTPSKPGVPRIDESEATTFAKIPVTPISSREARKLLSTLTGPAVPEEWQGGHDFRYRFGGGETSVKLDLDIDRTQIDVNNVIATIPGTDPDAGYVLVGGHRDTWSAGAVDNKSGWISTMELARALGGLYRDGWQPRRTIVLAGWDGEEYGLLGATEYAENHAQKLKDGALAYLNMDGTAGTRFGASSVPSLDDEIRSVADEVDSPTGKGSVGSAWRAAAEGTPTIGRLGSGSDYTAFLQHVGVPAAGIGFSSTGTVYHSLYDTVEYLEKFSDPGLKGVAAAAEVSGSLALRLANADILPMKYSAYASDVRTRLEAMKKDAPAGASLQTTLDAAAAWGSATRRLEARGARLAAGGLTSGERPEAAKINEAILAQERALLTPDGLPGRPWFKHQVWAPGQTTGYAVLPLPALAEATEAGDRAAFDKAAADLTRSLKNATALAEDVLDD